MLDMPRCVTLNLSEIFCRKLAVSLVLKLSLQQVARTWKAMVVLDTEHSVTMLPLDRLCKKSAVPPAVLKVSKHIDFLNVIT